MKFHHLAQKSISFNEQNMPSYIWRDLIWVQKSKQDYVIDQDDA